MKIKRLELVLKDIYNKHKEIILYCISGFLTYIIDTGIFYLLSCIFRLEKSSALLHSCSIFSTLAAVTFAYLTNKIYVFKSKVSGKLELFKELIQFYSARLVTLLIAEIFLQITVIYLGYRDWCMKLIINTIVIIINYVLSKFWIFGKKNI